MCMRDGLVEKDKVLQVRIKPGSIPGCAESILISGIVVY
jgi:hypothetical protein